MTCSILDKDQAFIAHDFGPGGHVAPVKVNLSYGLQPGSMISAVITTDQDTGINVRDAKNNILIHLAARVTKDVFAVNNFLDDKWDTEYTVKPVPVKRACRFVVTLVYEAAGYRVFVNGAEVTMYKHRSTADAHQFEIGGGMTFKVIYVTQRNIVPL